MSCRTYVHGDLSSSGIVGKVDVCFSKDWEVSVETSLSEESKHTECEVNLRVAFYKQDPVLLNMSIAEAEKLSRLLIKAVTNARVVEAVLGERARNLNISKNATQWW